MSEDLRFENLALQEALQQTYSRNQALREKLHEDADSIQDARSEQRRLKGMLMGMSTIAAIATALTLHYNERTQKADIKIQELQDANEQKTDALSTLARRAQRYQKEALPMSKNSHVVSAEEKQLLIGSFEERVAILRSRLGNDYIDAILEQTNKPPSAETPLVIESDSEVSTSELREYIKGFPTEWIKLNIKKIRIHKEEFGSVNTYTRTGRAAGEFAIASDSINIYSSAIKGKYRITFDQTVAHEIAHGNDWVNNEKLNVQERITLLAKIAARVWSRDRFVSSYVESINHKDPKTANVRQCEEYFAEVASAYFNCPDVLNYKDFQIIHELVTKRDPNFNIEEAKRARVYSFSTNRFL